MNTEPSFYVRLEKLATCSKISIADCFRSFENMDGEFVLRGSEIRVRATKKDEETREFVCNPTLMNGDRWTTAYFTCEILPLSVSLLRVSYETTTRASAASRAVSDGMSGTYAMLLRATRAFGRRS